MIAFIIDPLATRGAGIDLAEAEALLRRAPFIKPFLTEAKLQRDLPPLSPAQEQLVLGGEAPLWGEIVRPRPAA